MIDLVLVWAVLLGVAVLAYVVLDGFDLGIGILFPFFKPGDERDTAMNTVAPVWDGNETWLVLGGGGLFAAFPLAYAIVMPALYAPIIAMLIGLVFRGVAFEYRWRDKAHEKYWDVGFAAGSFVAAFSQGIVLGAFVQGIEVADRAYSGGWYDWLTPFSILTGVALVVGYALIGATWIILKTEGNLQVRGFRYAFPLTFLLVLLIAIVSIWTPFLSEEIAIRWFSWPNIAVLWPVPIFTLLLAGALIHSVWRGYEVWPFVLVLLLFCFCYIGLGVSLYPYAVPRAVTLWEAAAPDSSLAFMLVGASILIPVILLYTAYSYWVFRGKVKVGAGYH